MPLLAQAASSIDSSTFIDKVGMLTRPQELLDSLIELHAIFGILVMAVGILCIFQGYRWHRWIVVLLALLLGYLIGDALSAELGKSSVVAIAIGLLCAALASPLLKMTVAVFAGLSGACLGTVVWRIAQPDALVAWPGAAMGFILLALSSFLFFRISIILFTSLGGAAMLVIGGIASLIHIEAIRPSVEAQLEQHRLIIPLLVGVAAVIGFVLQETWTREGASEEG